MSSRNGSSARSSASASIDSPESHAASFALIAYATAYVKHHYPVVFACALLNAWPFGFYSPATVIDDSKRHSVKFLPIDILQSDWDCTLERLPEASGDRPYAVRIGLRYVKGLGEADWDRIHAWRADGCAGGRTLTLSDLRLSAGSPATPWSGSPRWGLSIASIQDDVMLFGECWTRPSVPRVFSWRDSKSPLLSSP